MIDPNNNVPRAADTPDTDVAVPAPARGWKPFLILFASLICIGIGQTLVFAVLPPAARDLGLSEVQVGTIFTVSAILWMVMAPFWGRRSDVVGRRPMILLGLSGYAVSMTAFAVSLQLGLAGWLGLIPAYVALIVSRSFYGLLGSAAVPAAQAYVAERAAPHERGSKLAQLGGAFALGTIVGPAVVAALLGLGLVAPFYAVGFMAFLGVLAVARGLPEDPRYRLQRVVSEKLSPTDSRVLPFLLIAVAVELSQSTAMLTAGFYTMDVLGMSSTESARAVGMMLMGTAGAVLFTQMIIIRLLQPAPRTMIGIGAGVAVLGFLIIVFSRSYPAMFTAMTMLGFAFGMMRPGVMTGASLAVSLDEQGGVAGLMSSTGGTGVILAPFVGMPLYQFLPQGPYMLSLLLAGGVLASAIMHPRLRAAAARGAYG